MYTTFIFRYSTNYNLGIVVVNALTLDEAKEIALGNGAWDTDDVTIINPNQQGIILCNSDSNGF